MRGNAESVEGGAEVGEVWSQLQKKKSFLHVDGNVSQAMKPLVVNFIV